MFHCVMNKYSVAICAALILLSGCSNKFKHPDVSAIDVDVKIVTFYQSLFNQPTDSVIKNVPNLKAEYGDYFDLYCSRVIKIGHTDDSTFIDNLRLFLDYEPNAEVIAECNKQYAQWTHLNDEMTDAMRCFKYYFPKTEIPHIYCHFSGFYQSLFVDSTHVSFSVEKYLGADCDFYRRLDIPVYLRKAMTAERVVPDVVKAMLLSTYVDQSEKEDLLSSMIYQGKILYVTKSIIPELEDSTLFNFSESQLEWCADNEAKMWGYLAEQSYLYNTNPLDISKFVNDSPFTTFLGQESPGRAVLYCAFNIIVSYMQEHKDVTIEQLMNNHDAQSIMAASRYRP